MAAAGGCLSELRQAARGECKTDGAASRADMMTPRERAARGDWRPIETAPKDGTWVLLYQADGLTLPVSMGNYYREEERGEDGRFLSGGWLLFEVDGLPSYGDPTHWMPLPDGPMLEARAGKDGN
jgi:hypothetical protein